MPKIKSRVGHVAGIAAELMFLRAENAELRPLRRIVKHLRQVVADQARETLELRREIYRAEYRKRQPSGRRRADAGNGSAVHSGIEPSAGSAG